MMNEQQNETIKKKENKSNNNQYNDQCATDVRERAR